eukprot:EC834799.1.p3 GENE.EC834799.1~~EC834799.1.p3  ORF type:complete len:50 (-),score=2.23 EC834799.1:10-159(-)
MIVELVNKAQKWIFFIKNRSMFFNKSNGCVVQIIIHRSDFAGHSLRKSC